jgi:pSer/pThr/pTyr-binding forkhead associated (FHA) protein/serine/threonine protein kinase
MLAAGDPAQAADESNISLASLTPDQRRLFSQLPQAEQVGMFGAPVADAAGGLSFSKDSPPSADAQTAKGGMGGSFSWLSTLILPYGSLREIHLSSDEEAPLIIHVQDAHGIEEAQRNIAGLIQTLQENRGVTLVGVEAAEGAFPLIDPLRAIARPEITRQVADAFLKEGAIGGPEYAALTSVTAPTLWGVERMSDHSANVQAVKDSLVLLPKAESWMKDLSAQAEALKERIYSPPLKEFDHRSAAYREEKESLGDYVRYLMQDRPTAGRKFPNLSLLVQALDAENNLDFHKVEQERLRLVEQLARILPRPKLDELVQNSLLHRMGQWSYGRYYGYLKDICWSFGVPVSDLRQFRAYVDYVLLAEKINREKLLGEMDTRELAVEAALADTPERKRLADASRRLGLVAKLIKHQMTPEDWAAYERRRTDVLRLRDDLASLVNSSAPSPSMGEGLGEGDVAALLAPFESFCSIALKRNENFTSSLLNRMKSDGAGTAVLVTGGFHSDDLVRRLTKEGASVVVVTPKITEVPKDSNYLDVFSRDPLPLEKMFSGQIISLREKLKLTGGPVVNRDAADAGALEALNRAREGTPTDSVKPSVAAALPPDVDVKVSATVEDGVVEETFRATGGVQVVTAAADTLPKAAHAAGVTVSNAGDHQEVGGSVLVHAQRLPFAARVRRLIPKRQWDQAIAHARQYHLRAMREVRTVATALRRLPGYLSRVPTINPSSSRVKVLAKASAILLLTVLATSGLNALGLGTPLTQSWGIASLLPWVSISLFGVVELVELTFFEKQGLSRGQKTLNRTLTLVVLGMFGLAAAHFSPIHWAGVMLLFSYSEMRRHFFRSLKPGAFLQNLLPRNFRRVIRAENAVLLASGGAALGAVMAGLTGAAWALPVIWALFFLAHQTPATVERDWRAAQAKGWKTSKAAWMAMTLPLQAFTSAALFLALISPFLAVAFHSSPALFALSLPLSAAAWMRHAGFSNWAFGAGAALGFRPLTTGPNSALTPSQVGRTTIQGHFVVLSGNVSQATPSPAGVTVARDRVQRVTPAGDSGPTYLTAAAIEHLADQDVMGLHNYFLRVSPYQYGKAAGESLETAKQIRDFWTRAHTLPLILPGAEEDIREFAPSNATIEKIGEGGFGIVFKITNPNHRRGVESGITVIKTTNLRGDNAYVDDYLAGERRRSNLGDLIYREWLSRTEANNYHSLYGLRGPHCTGTQGPFMIQTEYLPGESLRQAGRGAFRDQAGDDVLARAVRQMRQIVRLVADMNAAFIAHNDIRPENFQLLIEGALDTEGLVRPMDAGSAVHFNENSPQPGRFLFSLQYAAPELFNPDGSLKSVEELTELIGPLTDAYSLAVMLRNILPMPVLQRKPIWDLISRGLGDRNHRPTAEEMSRVLNDEITDLNTTSEIMLRPLPEMVPPSIDKVASLETLIRFFRYGGQAEKANKGPVIDALVGLRKRSEAFGERFRGKPEKASKEEIDVFVSQEVSALESAADTAGLATELKNGAVQVIRESLAGELRSTMSQVVRPSPPSAPAVAPARDSLLAPLLRLRDQIKGLTGGEALMGDWEILLREIGNLGIDDGRIKQRITTFADKVVKKGGSAITVKNVLTDARREYKRRKPAATAVPGGRVPLARITPTKPPRGKLATEATMIAGRAAALKSWGIFRLVVRMHRGGSALVAKPYDQLEQPERDRLDRLIEVWFSQSFEAWRLVGLLGLPLFEALTFQWRFSRSQRAMKDWLADHDAVAPTGGWRPDQTAEAEKARLTRRGTAVVLGITAAGILAGAFVAAYFLAPWLGSADPQGIAAGLRGVALALGVFAAGALSGNLASRLPHMIWNKAVPSATLTDWRATRFGDMVDILVNKPDINPLLALHSELAARDVKLEVRGGLGGAARTVATTEANGFGSFALGAVKSKMLPSESADAILAILEWVLVRVLVTRIGQELHRSNGADEQVVQEEVRGLIAKGDLPGLERYWESFTTVGERIVRPDFQPRHIQYMAELLASKEPNLGVARPAPVAPARLSARQIVISAGDLDPATVRQVVASLENATPDYLLERLVAMGPRSRLYNLFRQVMIARAVAALEGHLDKFSKAQVRDLLPVLFRLNKGQQLGVALTGEILQAAGVEPAASSPKALSRDQIRRFVSVNVVNPINAWGEMEIEYLTVSGETGFARVPLTEALARKGEMVLYGRGAGLPDHQTGTSDRISSQQLAVRAEPLSATKYRLHVVNNKGNRVAGENGESAVGQEVAARDFFAPPASAADGAGVGNATVVNLAGDREMNSSTLLARAFVQLGDKEREVVDEDVALLAENSPEVLSEALALRLYWDIRDQGISFLALNRILSGDRNSPELAGDLIKLSATSTMLAISSQPGLLAAPFLRRALVHMLTAGIPRARLTTEATKIAGRAAALKPWGLFRAIVLMHRGGSALVKGPLKPGSREEADLDRLIEVWFSQSFEAWRLVGLLGLPLFEALTFQWTFSRSRDAMKDWLADHDAVAPTGGWATKAEAEKARLTRRGTVVVLGITALGILAGAFVAAYFLAPWLGSGDPQGLAAGLRGVALALGVFAAGALSGNLASRLPHMIWNKGVPSATLTASRPSPKAAWNKATLKGQIVDLYTARQKYVAQRHLFEVGSLVRLRPMLDGVEAAYRESGGRPGLAVVAAWLQNQIEPEPDAATATGLAQFVIGVMEDPDFLDAVRGGDRAVFAQALTESGALPKLGTFPNFDNPQIDAAWLVRLYEMAQEGHQAAHRAGNLDDESYFQGMMTLIRASFGNLRRFEDQDLRAEVDAYRDEGVVGQGFNVNRSWPLTGESYTAKSFFETILEAHLILNGPGPSSMLVREARDSVVLAALKREGFFKASLEMVDYVRAYFASSAEERALRVSALDRAAIQRAILAVGSVNPDFLNAEEETEFTRLLNEDHVIHKPFMGGPGWQVDKFWTVGKSLTGPGNIVMQSAVKSKRATLILARAVKADAERQAREAPQAAAAAREAARQAEDRRRQEQARREAEQRRQQASVEAPRLVPDNVTLLNAGRSDLRFTYSEPVFVMVGAAIFILSRQAGGVVLTRYDPSGVAMEVHSLTPGNPIRIGRAPDNTIVVPLGTVSGRHMYIARDGDQITIHNISSTNGTMVVQPSPGRHEDRILEQFRFVWMAAMNPQPKAEPLKKDGMVHKLSPGQPETFTFDGEVYFRVGQTLCLLRKSNSKGTADDPRFVLSYPSFESGKLFRRETYLTPFEDTVIGRTDEGGANVLISDPAISAPHLMITQRGDQITFEDLGSRNGTRWLKGDVVDANEKLMEMGAAKPKPKAAAPAPPLTDREKVRLNRSNLTRKFTYRKPVIIRTGGTSYLFEKIPGGFSIRTRTPAGELPRNFTLQSGTTFGRNEDRAREAFFVHINDDMVSRAHWSVFFEGDQVTFQDLDSTNGTSFEQMEAGAAEAVFGNAQVVTPQPEGPDYYQILGVARNADEVAIKRVFRKLAMEFHPDRNPGDKVAEARMKEVNQAKEILSDPERRREYDRAHPVTPRATTFKTEMKGLVVWFGLMFAGLALLAGMEWPMALGTAGVGTMALSPVLNALTSLTGLAHVFERGDMRRDARALAEEHRRPEMTDELVALFGYFLHREGVGQEAGEKAKNWLAIVGGVAVASLLLGVLGAYFPQWPILLRVALAAFGAVFTAYGLARIIPAATAFVFGAAAHSVSNLRHMLGRPSPNLPARDLTVEERKVVETLDPSARYLATMLFAGPARPVQFDTRPGVQSASAKSQGKAFELLKDRDVPGAIKEALRHPDSVQDPAAFSAEAFGVLAENRVAVSDEDVLYVNADGVAGLKADAPERNLLMIELSRAARINGLRVLVTADKEEDLAAVRNMAPMRTLAQTGEVVERQGEKVAKRDGRVVVADNLPAKWANSTVQPVALNENSLILEGVRALEGIYLRVLSHEIAVELRAIVLKATQA